MLGAVPIDHREPAVYAFNRTYDIHTNGSRIALLISEKLQGTWTSASLSKNIQVEVKKGFKGQKLNITAYNDFHHYNFTVKIIEN